MNSDALKVKDSQILYLFFFFLLAIVVMSMPYEVLAAAQSTKISSASAGGIAGTMCKVTNALTGPIGKGIATIAVVVLGIGLFLGKLSWGLAMATAVGIGMIFSAGTIVNWLAGGSATTC